MLFGERAYGLPTEEGILPEIPLECGVTWCVKLRVKNHMPISGMCC